jgi:hypothetical protein
VKVTSPPFHHTESRSHSRWCGVCDQPLVRGQVVVSVDLDSTETDGALWKISNYGYKVSVHRLCASERVLSGGDK